MAIVVSAQTGATPSGNKTSEATFTLTYTGIGATDLAGKLLLLCIAADNAGTSGVSSVSGVTDSGGNTYALIVETNRTSGAALDGCTASIYGSVLTSSLSTVLGSQIFVAFSPNTAAKGVLVYSVTGSSGAAYATDSASGSGATYSSNASASMAVGDSYIGAIANESNTAPALDSDTTNGTWSTSQTAVSNGSGGDATKMSLRVAVKIVTGAGTQTMDAATGASTDWALAAALFTLPGAAAASFLIPHRHRGYIIR